VKGDSKYSKWRRFTLPDACECEIVSEEATYLRIVVVRVIKTGEILVILRSEIDAWQKIGKEIWNHGIWKWSCKLRLLQ
jgi:hypothetical protein